MDAMNDLVRYVLSPRRNVGCGTRGCSATAPGGDPAIPIAKEVDHSGNYRHPNHRACPPDFARQCHCRVRTAGLAAIREQKPHLAHQVRAWQAQQSSDTRILQRRQSQSTPLENRRQPARNPRTELAFGVKEQPPASVTSFPIHKLRCQRNHCPAFSPCSPLVNRPSSLLLCVLRGLCALCVKSRLCSPKPSTENCQLLTAFLPNSVITLPRNFTTPFNAPVGIRKISSNNPVITVKNSSMLSSRSRV